MIRSLLIILGSAIALAGCSSLMASRGPEAATAASCPKDAPKVGPEACHPFSRTYSGRELRQTGHTNLARALQTLDPSVTTSGPP